MGPSLGLRCMKILYVANDRRAAELAAVPLRTVGPDVAIAWAASLDEARRWIAENRDVAALIVEVESDNPSCELFVRQVRGLGVTAPVIVVSVNAHAPPLTALKAVANEVVTKDPSFLNSLPQIVGRTLHGAGPARRRLRLLYVGEAALARECLGRPGGSIEVVEAVPESGRKFDTLPIDVRPEGPPPFEIVLIEHGYPGVETLAILKDAAARNLHVPVVIVAEWDEELAVQTLKLGAIDYVVKSKASFRAVYFRLNRLIAHSALLGEQSKLRATHASTIDQERVKREDVERGLAKAQTVLRNVEQRLNHAAAAIERARQDRAADAAAADEHHAERESHFAARLAEAAAARQKLEQQLADRDAALRRAEQRATTEQEIASQDFARRQNELEAALTEGVARRRTLEDKLAEAEVSYQVADQRRLAEAAAFADKLAQQHAESTTSVAQAVRAREALEQRMNDAVAAIEQARRDRAADAAAAAEHLAQRKAVLISELANAAAIQERLERRLADADAALRSADERAAAEQHAARQQAIDRQVHIDAERARDAANLEALGQQLADAKLALQRAEEHYASEATAADARFAEHQARYDARLSEAAAAQDALHAQMAQAAADAAAALHTAAQRQANLEALEQQLADAKLALQRAEEHHASEATAADARFAEHQARYDARLSEAAAARDALHAQMAQAAADAAAALQTAEQRQANLEALERQLADTKLALQRAEEHYASEATAADARFAEHQARYDARLSEAAAAQDALHAQMAQAATDAAAALQTAEQRQANLEALEQQLADTKLALQRAEEHHASEATAADARFAEHQARYDARLSEAAAAKDALHAQLVAAEAARQHGDEQHTAEMAAAAAGLAEYRKQAEAQIARAAADAAAALQTVEQRQANLEAEFTWEVTNRQALSQALADAEVARQRTEEQHTAEMAAAAAGLAEYRKQAEAQIAQAAADAAVALQTAEQRAAAERQTASERQEAAEQAQRRFRDEVAAAAQSARERETRLEERAARERAQWEIALLEGQERIGHLQTEGALARQSLLATEEQIQRLESAHKEERANFERARMAIEADLARQRAEYTALQQTLDQTRATAQETLERVSTDRAAERARLEAQVAEREAQLQEQAARKHASDEAAATTLADVERRLSLTLAASSRDSRAIAQLQEQLKAVNREFEATRSQLKVLKTAAEGVPELRKQIDDLRAENRSLLEHTSVSTCRCGRDGAITQVNHALARLLGYDTPEDVPKVDFAAAVFESADELQWIVDRCLASRSTESIDTTWRRKDGSRIIVRVLALATTADSIDLTAQDITIVRVLEEKLRNSQRMEAVARYGSEIAVTCHNLLNHVKQEGQQWLARIDSDTARYQVELLLDDVARAAGFLRLLGVYGNEQMKAPELVDVNKVLRDLEPVLKRVAGGNVELVLPKASAPLNLDVEAERVERMLVNVAAYGRERMPLGGRLMIEVAAVVVDREFVTKYPNVRPGAHVLLTINEVRGAVRADVSASVRTQLSGANPAAPVSENPGVDLGALQALVTDCGGHLWMMAEPPGDMVLKIHLPRRVLDRPDPPEPAKGSGRAGWINRTFGAQH
jgi:PAS domain S-box-containing protein